MNQQVENNAGEVRVTFTSIQDGKVSFKDLGITPEQVNLESGFLRLVFVLDGISDYSFYQVPTIEVSYEENCAETHWQCEFNRTVILDKMDHYGHSTVLLLDRKKLDSLQHRHENRLVIHAEFPIAAQIKVEDSYIHLFK